MISETGFKKTDTFWKKKKQTQPARVNEFLKRCQRKVTKYSDF